MECMVWPWDYSIMQVAGLELAHGVFSSLFALLVSWPAAFWIWITYLAPSASKSDSIRSGSGYRKELIMAVCCMVLLSLGAGLCAHVLEDIFIGWF